MAAINPDAGALTALVLSARILQKLVIKGVLTEGEALDLLKVTAAEIGGDDQALNAACREALKAVFPAADI